MARVRNPNKRIMGNRGSRGPGTNLYSVELQGFNVLAEHFLAMSELAEPFFIQLLDVVGDIGIERAREFVPYDTGETHDSINSAPGVIGKGHKGEWSIRYGPTTFYAPFLEYGTVNMAPRAFMIPSGDLAERVLLASINAFLNLFNTNSGGSGFGSGDVEAGQALRHPRVRGTVGSFRSSLYHNAKFLGDVSVFGGRSIIGPARARMYHLARGLGDVSSIINGTLNQRISHRLSGRATGRIVGFGSASLSYGRTYSAFPGGEGGRRVYQRVVGRSVNLGSSSLNFGNLGNF